MATTAVNATITLGATYTVPAGKRFVGKAFLAMADTGRFILKIDGKPIVALGYDTNLALLEAGPLQAEPLSVFSLEAAGGVSATNPRVCGLSGFLFDV